ncbi:TGACG-sequence-specific DNA-binding protein TGA-1B-like [Solanum tuberosum]|uniref:TGACG-sequence-specific DNA-binding protein TGA-1B n=1 Tax=Solanum tuberosum TaxID=4113 RepID=M1DQF7_SOLTU|nr:PREDICTED: TGACG-sequence-specific DNA-binding protein TGA-1B-like [Solanum tuberosum]
MSNFVGNQAVGGVMVMEMSSLGLLHSWSSSGFLDEVPPSLHQVSTDVSRYLNVPSSNCGSNLTKGLNNLSDSNKLVHSSANLGSNSVKGGVVEHKLNANISNCSYLLKRKKGSEDSNNVSKHQKFTIFFLSDIVNNDEDK